MKFLSVLALSLAGSAMAKGDHKSAKNGTMSTKGQCKEVAKLTRIMDVANNKTLLDKASHNNATKASAIQAKASAAAMKLSTLTSNSTLMMVCNQIFAVEDMQDDCAEMRSMESLAALAMNSTKLASKTKNNATRADAIKAKVSAQASTLMALQSNTTLTAFCSVEDTKAKCSKMNLLQKEVNLAANQTLLDKKFHGNATKIAKYQEKAAKAQMKLTAMQSNTTLTDACSSLKSATQTTSNAATSSTGKASGAGNVKPVGAMVSLAAVFFAGVLLL